jgi:hypothetical protein
MYTTKQLPSATMKTLKQFSDKHVSMETHGQQYNTTIYINFELGHTTKTAWHPVCMGTGFCRLPNPILLRFSPFSALFNVSILYQTQNMFSP